MKSYQRRTRTSHNECELMAFLLNCILLCIDTTQNLKKESKFQWDEKKIAHTNLPNRKLSIGKARENVDSNTYGNEVGIRIGIGISSFWCELEFLFLCHHRVRVACAI